MLKWTFAVELVSNLSVHCTKISTGTSHLIRMRIIQIPKVLWKPHSCLSCVNLPASFKIHSIGKDFTWHYVFWIKRELLSISETTERIEPRATANFLRILSATSKHHLLQHPHFSKFSELQHCQSVISLPRLRPLTQGHFQPGILVWVSGIRVCSTAQSNRNPKSA